MQKLLSLLAVFALVTPPVHALWIAVPLEILVDEADLIVAGKVTKIQDGGKAIGALKFDVAVVEVSSILKSLPGAGQPKEIHLAQPALGGIAVSTDIRFRVGQKGVWLLTKDPERNVFWAKHPFQFQENQDKVAELVKARAKLDGGKAVNGLVARAELVEHKPPQGPSSYEVRFSLKNVSAKPITICDYGENRPLQVRWIGPDFQLLKSNHNVLQANFDKLSKTYFVTIPSDGVRHIRAKGSTFGGILFQPMGKKNPRSLFENMVQAGQHKVLVSFASQEDGKKFQIPDVWTGVVTANEVTFAVKE